MGNIIEWKTATQVIDYLIEQNSLVSGMSVAEAAASLGFTKTASGIYVKSIVTSGIKSIAGSTATAVATEVTGAAASTATNLVLFEGVSGTAQVGGLASVALPVASSILAAAGGFLIGKTIYEKNSDFLDGLMFPLYDFITGNNIAGENSSDDHVPTIPMIYDSEGNAYMDSRALDAVTDYLNSIGVTTIEINNGDLDYGLIQPVKVLEVGGMQSRKCFKYQRSDGKEETFSIKVLSGIPKLLFVYTRTERENHCWPFLYSLYPFTAEYTSEIFTSKSDVPETTVTSMFSLKEMTTSGGVWYRSSLGTSRPIVDLFNLTEFELMIPVNLYKEEVPYLSDAQMNSIVFNTTSVQVSGMPSDVVKYTPGPISTPPITFPEEVPEWVPVSIPDVSTTVEMPKPVEYPDPLPNPTKITPFINPIQPQPANVPVKKPDPKAPKKHKIVPVPNPTPNISTDPYPKSDPGVDASTAPEPQPAPVPEVPVTPTKIGDEPTPIPGLPVLPTISLEASGLLHVYNPTNEQINQFGSWLWSTFSGDLIETLSKLFNNPMDAVIGLHELYVTPITSSESTIKAGYLDSKVASRLVSNRYTEIKCGALSVPEYWGNYLDYAPYTKTFCYLPFIGIVELNADDIVGSGVEITYKIDSYNGSCIALITTAKAGSSECITYEFSGNCAVEIPITSGMKSAVQSALIGATTTAIAASVGGGGMVGASLIGGVRQGANSKNIVQHSGSFGSSYGAMGVKTPYIIVKRPKQKVVPGYNTNYGYPSHKMVRISECSGYLKAIEVDVVSPTATENEKQLIEKQLKEGIFVN